MLRNVEAHNLPATVSQDEHDKQQPECRRRYDEHVDAWRTPERVGSAHLGGSGLGFRDLLAAVRTVNASASRAGNLDGATGPQLPASPAP